MNDDLSAHTSQAGSATSASRRGALLPIAVFLALVVLLAIGLTLNPREVPSPLIGQPVPAFDLPPVKGRTLGLSSADLGKGEVSLVNVFASWCVACRIAYKHIGPITPEFVNAELMPMVERLRATGKP